MRAALRTNAKPYSDIDYAPKYYNAFDDTYDDKPLSKEEFFAKVDATLEEVRQGKGIAINSDEELRAYFNNL
ncbi:MAG: hypothetical protein LBT94_00020 [Prevotellaceae bacterium]|jgi:hypothetical protein|nr:hypothetical protein [Prevotellaceae bacterium]